MKIRPKQPILSLKPTQFSVGVLEIEHKGAETAKLSKRKLQKLIRKTPVPVVVSPWGELFVVDRHHFICVCWHLHVPRLRIEIVKNYSRSRMSYRAFWQRMEQEQCIHLYDQFGDGPREPLYLPHDIRGLADDPYRSLAWMARKEGAFENSDEKFSALTKSEYIPKAQSTGHLATVPTVVAP